MLMSSIGKNNDVSIIWEEFVRCVFHLDSDDISANEATGDIGKVELEPTVYVLEVEMVAASKWVIKAKTATEDVAASVEISPLMTTMGELQAEVAKQVSVPLELQRWVLDGKDIPLDDKATVAAVHFLRALEC